jgi:hypothetical protein
MREILFRGKTLDGDWIEGWYQPPAMGIGVTLAVFNDTSEHLTDIQVIPETVGQFTGLLDKNGKKIFEGDMVLCEVEHDSHPHRGSIMSQVKFIGGYFAPLHASNILSVEIIGNIHDNPEFLEVKK